MVWPFILTRTFSFSKTINAPPSTVLKIIHDPTVFFSLSPLITNVSVDPSSPSTYVVTDNIVILGFRTQTAYKCTLTIREDGVDADVVATVGTKLKSSYRTSVGEEGTTVFTEHTTVQGFFFLMPYIFWTMSTAHSTTFEALAIKAEQPLSRIKYPYNQSDASHFKTLYLSIAVLVAIGVQYSYYNITPIWAIVIFIGALSVPFWSQMTNDPYGLFHLSLNKLPGEELNTPPPTEWLNMGFWQNTDVFPQACAALATKLIGVAKYKTGGRVLDVGHGTGESLILLLSDPSVPRPSIITGITSLTSHHRRSHERVTRLLSSLRDPKPEVDLYVGDAVYKQAAVGHPLDPSSIKIFDAILALDCAYHFNTRKTFLDQSFRKLAPGGQIALADICFDPRMLRSPQVKLMTFLLKLVPKCNLVSNGDYIAQMEEIGYVNVQLEDITQDVFPGFIKFLKSRGLGWKAFAWMIELYVSAGARFVIVSGARGS